MARLLDNLPDDITIAVTSLTENLKLQNLPDHGQAIFNILDTWLLDDEQQQMLHLSPWNIYFLFAAAHLFTSAAATAGEKQAHITKSVKQYAGISDPHQVNILSAICSRFQDACEPVACADDTKIAVYRDTGVNMDLIVASVRLAALLKLDLTDTAMVILAGEEKNNTLSKELFFQSTKVQFTGPHPFIPGAIRVAVTCSHPEIHRRLKHHENRLLQMLHTLNTQISPRFLFSDVVFEITTEGYTPRDMKFAVDSMAALTLLTGNRLYSDRRVFLRELIQNAVDACNLKKMVDPDHSPRISVHLDSQTRVITFYDNGIGMDQQWIEKYFLKIGISFYRSGDLKNISRSRVNFNFISKFGIGFLSSFMVSDKIIIRTRKEHSPGLLITITNLQDYFDVRLAPDDCPIGTQVTLHLNASKNSYSRAMEFVCYLKTNMRFLSIPVELSDHEGKKAILGHEKLKYEQDPFQGNEFVSTLDFKDAKGYLFLKAKRNLDHLFSLEPAKGGISIFQDGIFVTQTDVLLPEGARQNVIGRINLLGRERCELSMDRNRIFWTDEQFAHIRWRVRYALADLADQLLNGTASRTPPLTVADSVINHLSIFFNFNEVDDDIFDLLPQPIQKNVAKRFRDFVRIEFAHTRDMRHVPEAEGYAEKWQQKILETFKRKARPSVPDY